MRVCQPSPQSALHSPHWPYTSWALLSNDWSEKGEPPPLPLELALPGWKGTSGGGGEGGGGGGGGGGEGGGGLGGGGGGGK